MPKTIKQTLSWAQLQLESADIDTARLDTLVLLEDTLGMDRAKILAEPNFQLTNEQFKKYKKAILNRTKHLPLAYIRQKTEFYGRDFFIDHRVLEPRPESETIIDELLKLCQGNKKACNIIDVGTGSGSLIITAKLELPNCIAVATDIDQACLEVAKLNSQKYECKIKFVHTDLIDRLSNDAYKKPCIIIANLPYVPSSWHINRSATHEPKTAIFGGKSGLKLYKQLFSRIDKLPTKPDHVITESMPPQHETLATIARNYGYRLKLSNDFIQVFSYLEQRQA